jgi:hypothetical protein
MFNFLLSRHFASNSLLLLWRATYISGKTELCQDAQTVSPLLAGLNHMWEKA